MHTSPAKPMLLCFHQPVGQDSCRGLIFCHDEQIPCDNCMYPAASGAPAAARPRCWWPCPTVTTEGNTKLSSKRKDSKAAVPHPMSGSPELGSSVSPIPPRPGHAAASPLQDSVRLFADFPFFFWGCSPALPSAVPTGLRLLWMPTLCPKRECRASETEQGSPQVSKMNGAVCAKGHM